jgi:hypothetical protein
VLFQELDEPLLASRSSARIRRVPTAPASEIVVAQHERGDVVGHLGEHAVPLRLGHLAIRDGKYPAES